MASSYDTKQPPCKTLVLDAGPLLSLAPLRGLAEIFYTVPQVLEELKDRRAREHFQQLGLSAGVRVEVKSPDSGSLSHVINFSKQTGDYSVLSHADLCVLALAYSLSEKAEGETQAPTEPSVSTTAEPQTQDPPSGSPPPASSSGIDDDEATEPPPSDDELEDESQEGERIEESGIDAGSQELAAELEQTLGSDGEVEGEKLDVELHRIPNETETLVSQQPPDPSSPERHARPSSPKEESGPLYEDPSDEDDGEGEWITPGNVALHKSRALQLLPGKDTRKRKGPVKQIGVGCMTADFAMQNVLLQMGLSLVGVEGKKIERVKTWVLRCHACFKICKDNSRKFCPSCGNPTLLRASVTLSSPTASSSTPTLQVHLKKNFQYKTRGTIYSIPAPKPGSAKTGPGEGLVLREDQTAWMRAQKHVDGKREREEKRMLNGALHGKGDSAGGAISSWMDPDWVPEILSTGTGGKGRSMRARGMDGDMPIIGYGKKNPNERKRRK